VKAALHEVMYAETREQAREAITRFATEYGAKCPKAVTTLEKDADALLIFFELPAEHWKHLRTSNVIESLFGTVRLRHPLASTRWRTPAAARPRRLRGWCAARD
jgi:putative transposase